MANMASRPRDEVDGLDVQVPLKLLHHSGLPQQVEPEKGKGDLDDVDDDDGDDDGGKYYMEGGRVGEPCLRPLIMVTICSLGGHIDHGDRGGPRPWRPWLPS